MTGEWVFCAVVSQLVVWAVVREEGICVEVWEWVVFVAVGADV